MFEVGQKVLPKKAALVLWENAPDVLEVKNVEEDGRFISLVGHPKNGESGRDHTRDWYIDARLFKTYTETEAERRGAKFGVTGVYNPTGQRAVVVSTYKVNTPDPWPEKERWIVCLDGSCSTHGVYAENIRLDHEPEYVAWADAPEHLKYDASRVYFDGKPVKWIAKPEGAFVDVAFVINTGMMEFSTSGLTVKL